MQLRLGLVFTLGLVCKLATTADHWAFTAFISEAKTARKKIGGKFSQSTQFNSRLYSQIARVVFLFHFHFTLFCSPWFVLLAFSHKMSMLHGCVASSLIYICYKLIIMFTKNKTKPKEDIYSKQWQKQHKKCTSSSTHLYFQFRIH